MPMAAAIKITMPLPTMALAMPPPVSPADSGSLVKKSQFNDRQPLTTKKPRTTKRIDTVSTVQMPVMLSITLLTMFRRAIRSINPAGIPSWWWR